jgi:uncharacterized protein YneF (UPF0154 family)
MDILEMVWMGVKVIAGLVIGYFIGSWDLRRQYDAGYKEGAKDALRAMGQKGCRIP